MPRDRSCLVSSCLCFSQVVQDLFAIDNCQKVLRSSRRLDTLDDPCLSGWCRGALDRKLFTIIAWRRGYSGRVGLSSRGCLFCVDSRHAQVTRLEQNASHETRHGREVMEDRHARFLMLSACIYRMCFFKPPPCSMWVQRLPHRCSSGLSENASTYRTRPHTRKTLRVRHGRCSAWHTTSRGNQPRGGTHRTPLHRPVHGIRPGSLPLEALLTACGTHVVFPQLRVAHATKQASIAHAVALPVVSGHHSGLRTVQYHTLHSYGTGHAEISGHTGGHHACLYICIKCIVTGST